MDAPIAVIDFGSQFTQLIVRRIRELGFFAKLYRPEDLARIGDVQLVVLSGGPRSVTDADAPDIDFEFLRGLRVPVLGVCYGMQLLNLKFGGDVKKSTTSEYGPSTLIPEGESCLTAGLSRESQIWMSHSDSVGNLPDGARVVGRNQEGQPVAMEWPDRFFGIQFHPEVSHSHEGLPLLKNFLSLATDLPPFEIGSFRDHLIETIREEVAGREVVCGVSGGVDSTVLAVLLKSAGVRVR
ncbi:MAG: glutamine-hydrolyzing GMP synthase, partial [Verrucomicrobiota bacterium]